MLRLNDCGLTDKSCSALATVLGSDTSLKELNMNNNNLQDSGVKLHWTGKCEVSFGDTEAFYAFKLSDCSITEEAYKALASALRSNPSHLIELDLTGNDPGQSGVKALNDLLQDPNCQLKTLRFLGPAADEACQYVTGIVGKNPLLLRELNLSEHELGDTRVNQIAALLQDKHCKLNTLILNNNCITEGGCRALAAALNSNPSNLTELDLSENKLGNPGMKIILRLFENIQCRLEKLKLSDCSITEEGYKALASALRSNPSHLIELDLTGNDPGQSGVKELSDLLQDPNCQLKTLRFLGPAADEACQYVTGIVGKNPLLLRELNLSGHELGDTRVNQIAALLQDKHCQLNTLILSDCSITEKGYKALASALRSNPSHLIELDLTGNDPGKSGVKLLNDLLQDGLCLLKTIRFLKSPVAEEVCEFLTGVLGKSPLLLKELDLSGDKLGDLDGEKLSALLMDSHSKLEKIMLNNCKLTEKSCSVLATVLSSKTILKEMNLNNSHLLYPGVKEICEGLKNPVCELKILNLCGCRITEEQCLILTSALKSNPSHLRELNLSENELGDSGVKNLRDLLMNTQFKLEKLQLSCCEMTDEGCSAVTSALKSNPSHLRELNLSRNNLGNSGVKNLSDLLMKTQFKLEKLDLCGCSITEKQCLILTSALKSNPSHLRELNLSVNQIKDTGVNHLCHVLKDSHCKLERLRLSSCDLTDEGCSAVTSALKLNPSHLRELDLSRNNLGYSGVINLSDLLMNPKCKLEKLDLWRCSITEKQCLILTSALKSNPSHLRELNLSENKIKNTGVIYLCDVLKNLHCKLERLRLECCEMTDEGCSAVTSALKSNPSHLRELNLSENKLGDSGVKNLSVLLMNTQFKLEKLHLYRCSITEKQCLILTSALKLNPSHLRKLNLSWNQIKNTGVNHLCDVLKDSHCKLERLSLFDCGITDVSSLTQSLTNTKALQFLKELDLRNNMIRVSKQQLIDVLRDSNCKLSINRDPSPKYDKCCIS
ncbi:protein NLRC5 [Labeo rohita]|uniref:protein NLRC5 n=1 Tax=Labeo rohita TaxID=84645 RepID=UPI0021E2AC05|nr:protein NLRC5 [Labeo rohita]